MITINADPTKYDISDGSGKILDTSTGVITDIAWSGLTAQTIGQPYSGVITFISINSSGSIVASSIKPTNSQIRDNIFLGVIVHVDGVSIVATNDEQMTLLGSSNQMRDIAEALGFINISGNLLSSNNLLTIAKSSGQMLKFGANYKNDVNDPHWLTLPAIDTNIGGGAPNIFQYRMQNGTSSALTFTNIISNIKDDGTNYPGATFGGGRWGVDYVFSFTSNALKIQPTQDDFKNSDNAIESIGSGAFVIEQSIEANGLLIGYIIHKGDATDLSDPSEAFFLAAGKFGSGTSKVAGGTQSLQSVYDNSIDPEIITDATRNGVTIQVGSGADTDDALEIKNTAGSLTSAITGEGVIDATEYKRGGVQTEQSLLIGTDSIRGQSTTVSGTIGGCCIAAGVRAFELLELSGVNNTAYGCEAGQFIEDSSNNTAIGRQALQANGWLSGGQNTAIGAGAMLNSISHQGCTAIGSAALRDSNVGNYQVAIGHNSGWGIQGNNSIAIGLNSLESVSTGVNLIGIGAYCDVSPASSSWENSICIGSGSQINSSNQCTLGNAVMASIRTRGNGVCDLGESGSQFKDLYLSGIANVDTLNSVDATNVIDMTTADEIDLQAASVLVNGNDVTVYEQVSYNKQLPTFTLNTSVQLVQAIGWGDVTWSDELGIFVAVGASSVMTSSDGITWTDRVAAKNNNYKGVAWSPELGIFCAVAFNGTDQVMTSPDGVTWTARVEAENNPWRAISWSPKLGLFCAISNNGISRVMTSPDGIAWTSRTQSEDSSWRGITWSPDLEIFCAVAISGTNVVMTSPDGITWTSAFSPVINLWRATWSSQLGLFAAISSSAGIGTNVVTSPDGVTWTARTTEDAEWMGIEWSPELEIFIATGDTGANRIMTSPDGITWTSQVATELNNWISVVWSPPLNMFVAISNDGTNRAMTIIPEYTWTAQSAAEANAWEDVTWSPELGIFCAVSASGTNRVMTSPDGVTWAAQLAVEANDWFGVTWSPELGIFCAVSASGTSRVMTSPDGITWTGRLAAAVNSWYDVTWSPELGIFCAVSVGGTNRVMTSPDGVTWTARSETEAISWRSVTWSPELGIFCAVSNNGTNRVMTSPDGVTWAAQSAAEANSWYSVTWSPELGLFCAVSLAGTNRVMTSPDGVTWTAQLAAEANDWFGVTWSPELGLFCAVSLAGTNRVMTSPDGVTWTAQLAAEANSWHDISWSPELGIFCAVSIDGINRVMITSSSQDENIANILTLTKMSTRNRNNIIYNKVQGSIIYNTDTNTVDVYDGIKWRQLGFNN